MKLFYRHFGSGSPVIILHGVFGLSDNWVTHGRLLAKKFSVYIPDLRNHGSSPHSPAMNYYAMTEDIMEFINTEGLNEVILIGHSMGGKVAMQFALTQDHPVSKLVVIDIAPKAYDQQITHLEIIHAMQSIDFDLITTRNEVEAQLSERIKDPRIRLFIMKNLQRVHKQRLEWKLNVDAISNNLDLLTGGIEMTHKFLNPVLFVKGGISDYIQDEDVPLIMDLFPLATISTIKNASHWVHADAPDELCHLLSGFLEKYCEFP